VCSSSDDLLVASPGRWRGFPPRLVPLGEHLGGVTPQLFSLWPICSSLSRLQSHFLPMQIDIRLSTALENERVGGGNITR